MYIINVEGEKMANKCENLIPDIVNPSPDYFCTWQTQLYATDDGKPLKQRACIGEKQLFNKEKPYGWAYFYEKARRDLILVMDDRWDVPLDGNPDYYGFLALNEEKFPSFTGNGISNQEAMKLLSDKIKEIGWKAIGGWVCAQKSALFPDIDDKTYFTERLKWAEHAKWGYWKVDWGERLGDFEFRKMLSELAHQYAPSVVLENARIKEVIPYSDTYRTYDVPAIMSIPMTIDKMRAFLDIEPVDNEFSGIINCEDEVYMAAALGCTMGIMRNPYAGCLPNGQPDPSFPDCHRRLKTKMAEVTRAVRWHRIAPAFGVDKNNTYFSDEILTDSWQFKNTEAEIESWWLKNALIKPFVKDGILTKTACSAISRNMHLPKVTPDESGDVPYVLASRNPNGVISVATFGRTRDRNYRIPKCKVAIEAKNADVFGIFGEYKELVIDFGEEVKLSKILAQDLAGEYSQDITNMVSIEGNMAIIPGDIIHNIGTSEQEETDTSEPGMVIKFF